MHDSVFSFPLEMRVSCVWVTAAAGRELPAEHPVSLVGARRES